MAATTLFPMPPSFKFSRPHLLKQRSSNRSSFSDTLFSSRSIFCGGFAIRKTVCGSSGLWVSNTMDEMTRTSAFRDRDSDEGVRVLEQEAFIDGPSEFRSKFAFRDMEETLNKLVGSMLHAWLLGDHSTELVFYCSLQSRWLIFLFTAVVVEPLAVAVFLMPNSKWIVSGLFGAVILWRHDAEALWFAAGSVLNAILSILLKRILNQERPSALKSDTGMSSSHAQSIFFTVMFAVLSNSCGIKFLMLVLCLQTYLRVSQQLHTVSQVLVGVVIGSIFPVLWYWSWNSFVLNAFISCLLVRIIVVGGSIGICLGFLVYVIRYWVREE